MSRMPVVFVGHGSPMNAIESNPFTEEWQRIGVEIPKPEAILSVSAHWYTRGTRVSDAEQPRMIYDMYGFPAELYRVQYDAPGSPALAAQVQKALGDRVQADATWGLDHGTWSVLCKTYPEARIPVVQLSIDVRRPPAYHFDVGRRLVALRDEGVLILGSGNVVHNLMLLRRGEEFAYDWAVRFNDHIRDSLISHRFDKLVDYAAFGEAAALSAPTPEHFYPLLYAAGAADDDEARVAADGVYSGAISMLSVIFGAPGR